MGGVGVRAGGIGVDFGVLGDAMNYDDRSDEVVTLRRERDEARQQRDTALHRLHETRRRLSERRQDERFTALKAERDEARAERDEARAERDAALASAAEMRAALERAVDVLECSSDAGRGWLGPEVVARAIEILARERDAALASAAEMRAALERAVDVLECSAMYDCRVDGMCSSCYAREKAGHALSSDAGRGWASPAIVAQAVRNISEAESELNSSRHFGPGCPDIPGLRSVRDALAALKGVPKCGH